MLLLAGLVGESDARPLVQTVYDYYSIKGNTRQALRWQMRLLGPKGRWNQSFYAYTRWQVDWQYQLQAEKNVSGRCTLQTLTVSVMIRIRLPQWQEESAGKALTTAAGDNPALRADWQTFYTALLQHEQQHRQHGIEAAQDLERALWQLPPAADCQRFVELIDERARTVIAGYRQRDKEFDRQTQHGALAGVRF